MQFSRAPKVLNGNPTSGVGKINNQITAVDAIGSKQSAEPGEPGEPGEPREPEEPEEPGSHTKCEQPLEFNSYSAQQDTTITSNGCNAKQAVRGTWGSLGIKEEWSFQAMQF